MSLAEMRSRRNRVGPYSPMTAVLTKRGNLDRKTVMEREDNVESYRGKTAVHKLRREAFTGNVAQPAHSCISDLWPPDQDRMSVRHPKAGSARGWAPGGQG